MKIVQQSHEWITPLNRDVTLPRIEQIARTQLNMTPLTPARTQYLTEGAQ